MKTKKTKTEVTVKMSYKELQVLYCIALAGESVLKEDKKTEKEFRDMARNVVTGLTGAFWGGMDDRYSSASVQVTDSVVVGSFLRKGVRK